MLNRRASYTGLTFACFAALYVGASGCSSGGSSNGTGGAGGHVSSTGGAGGHAGGAGGSNLGTGGAGGAGGSNLGTGGAAGGVGGGAAGGHAGAGGAAGASAGGAGGSAGAGGRSAGGAGGAAGAAGGQAGSAGGAGGGGGAAVTTTANLIVNPGADADVGSTDGAQVAITGWTVTGLATPQQYGMDGYPDVTDPGPADRGANLFIGGGDGASASVTQTISLTTYTAAIAGNQVSFTLSGYLGGFSSQDDQATLTAAFKDSVGTVISTATLGPVLAADRNNVTSLLFRTQTGAVPVNARSVVVTVTMTRLEGTANDGYADSLSLVLTGI